jgi:hypothetical protein
MHAEHLCPRHGPVAPLHRALLPDPTALVRLVHGSAVPAWLPWPLPPTWVFTGLRLVGGAAQPVSATAVGLTGAALTSGPADLIVVSEQPGTGLGARLAGLADADPGPQIVQRPADSTVSAGGWPTPVWSLAAGAAAGAAAYVGQAAGNWLWLIAWPEVSWSVIHDDLHLVDVRSPQVLGDLPQGALMPRLRDL